MTTVVGRHDSTHNVDVGGPFFEDLAVGQVFDAAPSVTFTDGMAAVHRSILGSRLRLPLDASLSRRVAGDGAPMVDPGLVWDVAIGQSTIVTHHVKANLFYRGLMFRAFPRIGDTMTTTTTVTGLRENSPKPGRHPTGLAALRIESVDQDGRSVLDFHRCAMLPLGTDLEDNRIRHSDDLGALSSDTPEPPSISAANQYDLGAFRESVGGAHFTPDLVGTSFESSADVVSSAPELARLSLNIAATHHDERSGPTGRLVYGGHTIGLAFAQATRALPNIVTVLGWRSCDHLAPVRENDTLTSSLLVERAESLPGGGGVLHLCSRVRSLSAGDVLDWKFSVLMA